MAVWKSLKSKVIVKFKLSGYVHSHITNDFHRKPIHQIEFSAITIHKVFVIM